ncbi:MAG: hypothetical protein ACI4JE_07365 [Ruminococcus sp.]
MKIDIFDILWCAVSMIIIAVSMWNHVLIKGLLIVFGALVFLCLLHIFRMRARFEESVAVYGEITGYKKYRSGKVSPIVRYETEDEIPVEKEYACKRNVKEFMIGDSVVICYFPDDFRLFYFQGRENELNHYYIKLGISAAFVWIVLLLLIL